MLSRNQLHTHAHRYGHATWKWIWRRLSWICGAKCEMRLSLRPTDAVLLSTCSLAQCPIAFGWAATWYAVAWRGDWAGWPGWDQLSTHGGRSVNCCGMRKMTLMSRLQLDLCLFFFASSLGSRLLIELWDESVEGTMPFEWPNLGEKGNELLGIHSADSGSP